MLRGGTENVAGIVGLTRAFDLAHAHMSAHEAHIRGLKARMVAGLKSRLPEVVFNGDSDREDRLYTVLNVKFPKHPNGGMAVFLLDLEGIACSGGSACSSGATMGSHVLRALGFHDPDRPTPAFRSPLHHRGGRRSVPDAVSKVFDTPSPGAVG